MDKLSWYSFLTFEFRLAEDQYVVSDKAAFACSRCERVDMVRIDHVKNKIKSLGTYECSGCRRAESIARARKAFKDKYPGKNPFELDQVKALIREKRKAPKQS